MKNPQLASHLMMKYWIVSFSSQEKRQGCLFSFQYCAGDSSKAIKFIPTVKNEVKLSGFTDDTILYIFKKPIKSSKKQGELIREFSEVAGHKINIQKSIAFVYTHNEKLEIR